MVPGRFVLSRYCQVLHDDKMRRSDLRRAFLALPQECAVQGRKPIRADFPALGLCGVAACSIPELVRAHFFGDPANPVFHIFTFEVKWFAGTRHTTYYHVNVWMLGIVMRDRDPFEISPEILLHPPNQISRQALQVNTISELRREDEFPQPSVASRLPPFQFADHVDGVTFTIEPGRRGFALRRTLTS
jgi:hypothetical protein